MKFIRPMIICLIVVFSCKKDIDPISINQKIENKNQHPDVIFVNAFSMFHFKTIDDLGAVRESNR